jgi:hypothetical protein
MMGKVMRRGAELAEAARRRRVQAVVASLKEMLRGVTVEAEEARVLVTGRGLLKRWLIDPRLRFLSGGGR